jgi:pilus assembly protein FimV
MWVAMNNKSCMTQFQKREFFRPTALIAALAWGFCVPSLAAELGKATGSPILGRPLQVSIPITLDAPADEPCSEVQVFFGETRAKTQDIWIPTDNPQSGRLQITSAQPVDEPIVTLYVAVNCGGQMSRKYVFLTELVLDAASVPLVLPATPATKTSASTSEAVVAPAAAKALSATPKANTEAGEERVTVSKKSAVREKPRSVPAGQPSVSTSTQPKTSKPQQASNTAPRSAVVADTSPKSRLKLEPLALLETPVPTLKSSDELAILSPAVPASREAAAAAWKMLNSSPEELAKEKSKLQVLEVQIGQMESKFLAQQELLQKFQAQADSQTFQNRVLMALVALMAAAAFFIYRSTRQTSATPGWWGDASTSKKSTQADVLPVDEDDAQAPARSAPAVIETPKSVAEQAAPQVALANVAQSNPAPATANPVSQLQKLARGTDSLFAPLNSKTYDVQELFDVQEQAEFFSSVGQYHRAVDVLKEHVRQNPDVSVLAYLDLFALYHRLNKRREYEDLIAKFTDQFSVEVPKFEEYGTAAVKQLEDYPDALNRIMDLWPHEQAMDVIAQYIFTKPAQGQAFFTLEAYRELLMLYVILRDEREGGVSDQLYHSPASAKAAQAEVEPLDFWATTDTEKLEPKQVADIYKPKSSHKIGLDIDLSGSDKSKK